jgi:hypothetical protein
MSEPKQHRKGKFFGIGMAIGMVFGIPIGIAMGNIALGPAMGLPIGVALGMGMEQKYNPNPLPETEVDRKNSKKWSLIGIGVGLLAAVILAIVYLKYKG